MVRSGYVPARGDVVWLDFHPQAGHEQAGRRPALVLFPVEFNGKTGLAICCPITNKPKGYSIEEPIPAGLPVTGVVLTCQVKCLDWVSRRADFICVLPPDVLGRAVGRLLPLIDPDSGGD